MSSRASVSAYDLACDALVIGGGVVGLAVAHALSKQCRVVLAERHRRLGEELSTRNSGVVHVGIYYPPGSDKAMHCVRGKAMLYGWCKERDVPHARTSKLLVARNEADLTWLEQCVLRAEACDVTDLRWLDRHELRRQEPNLRGFAALRSPSSGVVDAGAFVHSLAAASREQGVDMALATNVVGFDRTDQMWEVSVEGPGGRETIAARWVINAAGLGASQIATAMHSPEARPLRLVKGSYFRLRAGIRVPRTALVYPTPSAEGLGIHLTRELDGTWIAGPDTEAVDAISFDVEPSRAEAFAADLRAMLPSIRRQDLEPHFASVRPKLGRAGQFEDFTIAVDAQHNAVQLLGIESPGLTSALSVGQAVSDFFREHD